MLSLRRRIALEVNRSLVSSLIRQHPLTTLFWECTLRCNFACRHCGSDCHQTAGIMDMPLEDFIPVLENIAGHTDPHKVMINVTGGEPLMRQDLERCGREFHRLGFPWGIVTNGWLLTQARFESLRRSHIGAATVSLDGIDVTHEWMRGRNGSFARALSAIDLLVAANGEVVFDVVTCVNRRSIKELQEIKNLLIAHGVREWRLFTIFPTGRAANDPELQLSPDEFRNLMCFIRDTRREGRIKASYGCEGFLGNFEGDVRNHFFYCGAGVSVASVMADGSIAACPSIRADYSQGSIYTDDFWKVWTERYDSYRDRSWMQEAEPCRPCKWFRYCRGNGMHLRDSEGRLMFCHLQRLNSSK